MRLANTEKGIQRNISPQMLHLNRFVIALPKSIGLQTQPPFTSGTVLCVRAAATGPALGIMAASYSNCDRTAVVACFTFGMGLMGAFVPSLKVNPLDLSPNYAGSLMALVGGVGAISGIFAPYVVGVLTTNVSIR